MLCVLVAAPFASLRPHIRIRIRICQLEYMANVESKPPTTNDNIHIFAPTTHISFTSRIHEQHKNAYTMAIHTFDNNAFHFICFEVSIITHVNIGKALRSTITTCMLL